MIEKRRLKPTEQWSADTVDAPKHISVADSSYRDVASPAALLQARVGAALAAPNSAYALGSNDDRWPAPARMVILLVAAVGSWIMAWEAIKFLI